MEGQHQSLLFRVEVEGPCSYYRPELRSYYGSYTVLVPGMFMWFSRAVFCCFMTISCSKETMRLVLGGELRTLG